MVGLCFSLAVALQAGCSPAQHRRAADEEVYSIIETKWRPDFGTKVNYTISDGAPRPHDLRVERQPETGALSLADAVALATVHNREYEGQKEQLYKVALDLTLARHQFARQWFGTVDAAYVNDAEDERVQSSSSLGFNQALASGAEISASIALDWIRFLTGDPRTSLGSVLRASFSQPLLRGRGRAIAQENLTQAERDALY